MNSILVNFFIFYIDLQQNFNGKIIFYVLFLKKNY